VRGGSVVGLMEFTRLVVSAWVLHGLRHDVRHVVLRERTCEREIGHRPWVRVFLSLECLILSCNSGSLRRG